VAALRPLESGLEAPGSSCERLMTRFALMGEEGVPRAGAGGGGGFPRAVSWLGQPREKVRKENK